MRPEQIAGDCRSGDCPAVFDARDGNVAVRGVPRTDIHAGDGDLAAVYGAAAAERARAVRRRLTAPAGPPPAGRSPSGEK